MKSPFALVMLGAAFHGMLLAEDVQAFRLPEDSPIRSDRPAGWVHETLGSTSMLRYHPGPSHVPRQANVADLVAAISNARANSPVPLGAISLGDYLRHSPVLQAYLSDQLQSKHQSSLLKAMARPGMMPIQGVDDAPPLPPTASEVLKEAPEMKEIRKALQSAGYGIRNITWDRFLVMEGADRLLFMGNVILHLQPLPDK
jgi:hypothetical protein